MSDFTRVEGGWLVSVEAMEAIVEALKQEARE